MLRIDEVWAGYGQVTILRGVTLEVGNGEIVALIGSNGAGKSTMLRAISGLVRPSKGTILFDGAAIAGRSPHAIFRNGIAHVPEERKIFPDLTVTENLKVGALFSNHRGSLKRMMDELFDEFPILAQRRDQMGGTLSGGEQQILAISRGLMSQPRCLLLDEPSLGLSPIMVQEVFEVIRKIGAKGLPILLVEQNSWAALDVAQRGYVLETGEVRLSGSAEELARSPHVRAAYLGVSEDQAVASQ